VLATLEDLDELALKRILTEPKNSLVKQYQRLFEMEGVDLILAREAVGAIAMNALDRKTGARGLHHGGHSARPYVRPAEPRRRREDGDLQESRGGHRTAALHLGCSRPG
jgi:hypothetical protein